MHLDMKWFKVIHSFYFLCLLTFLSCGSSDALSVYGLKCEYLDEPLGISDPYRLDEPTDFSGFSPRLSWKVTAKSDAKKQTEYRVVVTNKLEDLKQNREIIWDSGIVESSEQFCYIPDSIIQSGSSYYWKVGVYHQNATSCVWSKPTRFSVGLLPADWEGTWISHPTAPKNSHIWYRKTFTHSGDKRKSCHYYAYVASIGYHELYINGNKIDNRVLAPAISRIDKRVLYVTYDITKFLKKGQNTIALNYGPGWSMNNYFARNKTTQAVRMQIADDRNHVLVSTNDTWLCYESYSKNIGHFNFMDMGGELVDGRKYSDQWMMPGFDDSQWQFATIKELEKQPILTAQMTEPTEVIEIVSAKVVSEIIDSSHPENGIIYRVDMGKQFTGFLKMAFRGLNYGDTVEIMISMRDSNPDLVQATYGIDNYVIEEQKQKHIYIARGENGEEFQNRFNFFAGRYIHFRGLKKAPELHDIKGLVISSAPEITSTFECSDSLYNQIYALDLYTYQMCHTEGVVVDCPNRERLGYGPEGAYQTMWGLGLPCFNSAAYYIKNVRDWGDVQDKNGFINNVAPQISYMYGCVLNGTAILNTAWEHYLIYGDKRILTLAYSVGQKWLGFLESHTEDSMLKRYASHGYFLGDWVSPGPKFEYAETEEALFFNNCAYAMTLDFMINIALEINEKEEVIINKNKLDALRSSLHNKYFNLEKEYYLNGDQVRTSFALYSELVPDTLQEKVHHHLKTILNEQQYINVGSFGRYPFYKVLLNNGEYIEILDEILRKETYPGYGYFVHENCTAFPEMWEIDQPNSSVIHTSYTGISAFFFRGLAGIRNISFGEDTILIAPEPIDRLSWCKAEIETPYGQVKSEWKRNESNITYSFSIPFGMTARIKLKNEDEKIVNAGTYYFNF